MKHATFHQRRKNEYICYCFMRSVWTFAPLAITPSIIAIQAACVRHACVCNLAFADFLISISNSSARIDGSGIEYIPLSLAGCVRKLQMNGTKLFRCDFHRYVLFSLFRAPARSTQPLRIRKAIPHRVDGDPVVVGGVVVIVLIINSIPYLRHLPHTPSSGQGVSGGRRECNHVYSIGVNK